MRGTGPCNGRAHDPAATPASRRASAMLAAIRIEVTARDDAPLDAAAFQTIRSGK
ncbi:hypothetical protein OH687_27935 [Burkholderia anthina]|nr:hypothetical protein OH687_27935 [Burkholderia anthina]